MFAAVAVVVGAAEADFTLPFWFQLIVGVASGITTLGGLCLYLYRTGKNMGREELSVARQQIKNLASSLDTAKDNLKAVERQRDAFAKEAGEAKSQFQELKAKSDTFKKRVMPYYHGWHHSQAELKELRKQYDQDRRLLDASNQALIDSGGANTDLLIELERQRVELLRSASELKAGIARMRRALKLEGFLWQAKPRQKWARARPLAERKHAVISVLNLKGGVGKTTITAHLGAALAKKGYRVLLIDLDLQGSLSTLLLPTTAIESLSDGGRLVQDYFAAAAMSPTTKLLDYAAATRLTFEKGKLDIVPTSDRLGYAEFNLTLRWLLQEDGRDARFLLRRGVQRAEVGGEYDIVLVDCPPLFNMSCINSLAASDFLLIPAAPSVRALERVPQLLRTVREQKFLNHVNFELRVLGVVPNRTYRENLTQDETRLMNTWMGRIKSAIHVDVKQFAPIPQRKSIHTMDEQNPTAAFDSDLDPAFSKLADEIEKELPYECRVTQ